MTASIDGIATNSTQVGKNSTSVAAAVGQQTAILGGLRTALHAAAYRDGSDNLRTMLEAIDKRGPRR